jgi:hypothetical protein
MTVIRFITILSILIVAVACTEKTEKVQTQETQKTHHDETKSEVPELWAFHDVIYEIWHEAWPAKDTDLLTDLIPAIEKGYQNLSVAKLPGILHDKQEKWSQGISNMGEIIETYKTAASEKQNEALLKAAEDLHTQFEQLVRLIRPVLKEIDFFHQELYMLYHYYLPDYDIEKIQLSTAELIKRMDPIDAAQLPARLKEKQDSFDKARQALRESLVQLQKTVAIDADKETVSSAVESMHDQYQAMMAVFE